MTREEELAMLSKQQPAPATPVTPSVAQPTTQPPVQSPAPTPVSKPVLATPSTAEEMESKKLAVMKEEELKQLVAEKASSVNAKDEIAGEITGGTTYVTKERKRR